MSKGSVAYRALRVSDRATAKADSKRVTYTLVTQTEVPAAIVENLTARELLAWLASRQLLPFGAAFEDAVVKSLRVSPVRIPVT